MLFFRQIFGWLGGGPTWAFRPLVMQLDLQSVQKGAFAPKLLEIGHPRLRMDRSSLQDLSRLDRGL